MIYLKYIYNRIVDLTITHSISIYPLNKFFKMKLIKFCIWISAYLAVGSSTILNRLRNKSPPQYKNEDIVMTNTLPFPQWLTDFTGLKEWPGLDPPYIPLEFIKFDPTQTSPLHTQGLCAQVKPEHCSFDCINCISFDDIFTCPRLSQTFDDGPTEHTMKLINSLKSKSTFFALGVQIIKYPQIYRETMARGHIMGSHTWSHKFLPSLTNEQIVAQIEWSIWAMNATGNHLPKWFRPPYGGVDNRVRSIVRQFGMQSVLWDMDTFDWKLSGGTRTEADIVKEVKNFQRTRNGAGMILQHDATIQSVDAGIKVQEIVGPNQLTVPQCANGINYIKVFQ